MKLMIISFLIFILTALIYYIAESCTVKEAVIGAVRWWADIFREVVGWKAPPTIEYPVNVGFDGMNILPGIVDVEMKKLRDLFQVCYCKYFDVHENKIIYLFAIKISPKMDSEMEDFSLLVQKQCEECLTQHLRQYGCYVPAETLTATELRTDSLVVSFARNEKGIQEITDIKQRIRAQRYSKELLSGEAQTFTERWDSTPETADSSKMTWGYQGDTYREHTIKIALKLEIKSHPHALITGSSGSGKSQALLFLIGKLLQVNPETGLYVCDFKKSEEFRFLESYPHYYAGEDCYEGIMKYYQRFSEIRENGTDRKRYLLICDEYPSLINHLQMKDKQNKSKQANEVLGAISEILMLGRGTGGGFGCWIVTQYAQSSLFSGSRDNFMVVVGLGRLSKEQRGMVFQSEEIPDRIFTAGEGMLLADGMPITEVKYPLIADVEDWDRHILNLLMRNAGACAGREA